MYIYLDLFKINIIKTIDFCKNVITFEGKLCLNVNRKQAEISRCSI